MKLSLEKRDVALIYYIARQVLNNVADALESRNPPGVNSIRSADLNIVLKENGNSVLEIDYNEDLDLSTSRFDKGL